MQGQQPLGHPRLNLVHPMVSLRQTVGQPDHGRPAQADPLPVAMRLEVVIQQVCYTHLGALRQQKRKIIHAFCHSVQLFGHADSFSHVHTVVST